jgi:hypothetical protein
MQRKQTTNAAYNLTVGKAINATVYKVQKKRETEKKAEEEKEECFYFFPRKLTSFFSLSKIRSI